MTTLSLDGYGHVDKTVGLILTIAGLEVPLSLIMLSFSVIKLSNAAQGQSRVLTECGTPLEAIFGIAIKRCHPVKTIHWL